jgi:hydroxyproline O-arabinosyltransferase
MSAAARKSAGSVTARAPAMVLALAAAGAFLISYNFFAVAFRGAGGAAAGAGRDPVVPMPAWMRAATGGAAARRRPFHVALTATDAAYSRWQCRVMYYWYKQMQVRPGGEAMGGFTRVLHSGKPDALMDEIPTFVVDPLPAGKDHVSIDKPSQTVPFSLLVDRRGGHVGLQKILCLNDML